MYGQKHNAINCVALPITEKAIVVKDIFACAVQFHVSYEESLYTQNTSANIVLLDAP